MAVLTQPTRLTSTPIINGDSTNTGGVWSDNGALWSDGNGQVSATNLTAFQAAGTVQTLSTGNTITTTGTINGATVTLGTVRVTAAAAVTGIIIAAGSRGGQLLTVIHEGAAANTITFAASGTSNVADGTSDVITGPSARMYVWDRVTALWYAIH